MTEFSGTHSSTRMLIGYRTGMRMVAELSSRRLEFSFSLRGQGRGAPSEEMARLPDHLTPAQACGWARSPVHGAVQLDNISKGAVEQCAKHHLEVDLAEEQR